TLGKEGTTFCAMCAWPVSAGQEVHIEMVEGATQERISSAQQIKERRESLLIVPMAVGTHRIGALLDSGASSNFISKEIAALFQGRVHKQKVSSTAVVADGKEVPLTHKLEIKCRIKSFICKVSFWVLDGLSYEAILGYPWLSQVNPTIDWPRHFLTIPLNSGGSVNVHGDTDKELLDLNSENVDVITALQFKRILKKKDERPVIALVREADEEAKARGNQFQVMLIEPHTKRMVHKLNALELGSKTSQRKWDDDGEKHLFDGFEIDEDFEKVVESIEDPDIRAVLWKYRDRFPQDLPSGEPPSRGEFDMKIKLDENYKPKRQGLFRYSPKELAEMRDQISYLLEKKWIRPSHSPYGSPVLFAPKPGGKLRMCIDYRSVNKGTIKSSYPLPRVEEMFDHVVGSKWFSKIDLRSGYWQIKMEDSSIPYTSFKTRYGSFEWLVMPFGLSTAPSCFQHLVNSMLGNMLDLNALVFIDDILIFSKEKSEHARHIEAVLRKLREFSLFAKFSKCEWLKQTISFLGHVLDRRGLRPMKEKTAIIEAWPEPQNVSEVRSFLGLTGYYRKFVSQYAQLCAPLTDLTKQGVRFSWSKQCQESFNKLKAALVSEPLLRHPEPSKEYHVYTDSSMRAIGGVVAQSFEDGEHPVQFESRL
ncbi:MAG: retropepsin-like aspartic protease/reverse transcriptase, partial [Bacteroidota bacterium]